MKKDDESYFDKYLNEVLYIFQNADVDVIVFEDIDRFDSNKIFEKLREINYLVNKKSYKCIRFFYLLRDDIFVTKDRTKFFDFILPIVPVIDGSNSYDQFIEHFREAGIIDRFDENFLQGLSLYIDDMRILKNIYNEYVVYSGRIQSTELKDDKLLAVVTYKNIFPKDFSELQLGRGFVYNVFACKVNFVTSSLKKIDIEIDNIKKQMDDLENELLEDIDELDAVFLVAGNGALNINGKYENQYKSRAEFIRAMKSTPGQVRILNGHYNNDIDIISIINSLSSNPEYVKRKEAI